MPSLDHYLSVAALLFIIGVMGVLINRNNIISILLSIEIILLSININFVSFSHYLGDLEGQIFVFFILTVTAAESAIGLAIFLVYFRNRGTLSLEEMQELKG